ncbi:hypothetical protein ACJRO7_035813 [Eucalyptus globulus]|uniref:SKP1-like protein n=1 Tax=Eucalyptus globulus TaxID=34317 RepID=A0ABD3J8L9_EUCGL
MATSRKVTLLSSDGESFEVEQSVAVESITIKDSIEEGGAGNAIPVPNVHSKILAKVIEYCKKHVESAKAEDRVDDEDLVAWDADFVEVDRATLFDLILAANYLDIKSLFDLTSQAVADIISGMIKGKTLEETVEEIHRILGMEKEEIRRLLSIKKEEEIRRNEEELLRILGIENDFTPEE